jgi:hypothetical protein
MEMLWTKDESSILEVLESVPPKRKPASGYCTVTATVVVAWLEPLLPVTVTI